MTDSDETNNDESNSDEIVSDESSDNKFDNDKPVQNLEQDSRELAASGQDDSLQKDELDAAPDESAEAPLKNESKSGRSQVSEAGNTDDDSDEDVEVIQPENSVDSKDTQLLENSFDEAYDFESGDLISDDPKAGIPVKNIVSSAKEFFNMELLYRYDILEDKDRNELKGTYQIDLFTGDKKADREVSSWSLNLEDDIEVKNEEANQPLALLSMSSNDFIRLVNGDLNPQLAFLAKKIKSRGNLEAALSIQKILAPVSEFSGKVYR